MLIINSSELRNEQKKYFELAETEAVYVRRGKKYIRLTVTDNIPENQTKMQKWVKEFLAIPEEYRCDPFEYSPSGDLFFADKRNIDKVKMSVESIDSEDLVKVENIESIKKLLDL